MTGSLRGAVVGTGSYAPQTVMTNADFEKILDTSDEWIVQRTGIRQRHLVADGESSATLATEASRRALDDAGMAPGDLDLIVCATVSPDMLLPSTACFVQEALGATDVPAFDVSAACSGFVYALATANGFISQGLYRRILVIGVDTLSRFADFSDRGSCILFGDGAGAAVIEATDRPDRGVRYLKLGADGKGWDYICMPAGGSRKPATAETVAAGEHFIKMRGRDVYKFAVEKMAFLLEDAMAACNLSVDDIDMVIPHQVNQRIIESATEKVNFPMDKVYVNIERYGNTSGASIPLALDEARRNGQLGSGATVLMVAFGAGLTWGGAVVGL
ncbi:MAG: ketoacyl-ACP synthase III [Planctomycetes bacterium]|nr:ketoacyl-ACP synthase III [Planctomycetota bacterium]